MKKGEITAKILETIGEVSLAAVDVIEAVLTSGYGASYGKLRAQVRTQQKRRSYREIEAKEKQRFHNLISQLKKDGLIKENAKDKGQSLFLTAAGKNKLLLLKQKIFKQFPRREYEREKSNKLIIFIFDIPEKQKAKRNWLRNILKELDFRMIQKSVWIGTNKISLELLKDLKMLNLIGFIEIFEVSKAGSLKEKFQ